MSRRPSLPGAAELFRATGGVHAPAEPAAGREMERPVPRLRPAEADPSAAPDRIPPDRTAPDRTASVTQLGTGAPARVVDGLAAPSAPAQAPRPGDPAPPVAPVSPVAPLARSAAPATGAVGPFDEEPARRQRGNGVRQTRRQRVRTMGERRPTGRELHEEKITVYCSAEELFDLETARLGLRGEHGLVVDRGRIVREAVAIILADLEAKGDDSILVRRLREL